MARWVFLFSLILACFSLTLAKKHSKHGGGRRGGSGSGSSRTNHANHTRAVSRHAGARNLRYHNKIVGGEPATVGEFPYQVAVQITKDDGAYGCGGSILNKDYILTAAHCVYGDGIEHIVVRVGTIEFFVGTEHDVEEFTIHPEYEHTNFNHDSAILKLASEIEFNDNTQKIELTTEAPEQGTDITIAGWGTTEEDGSQSNVLLKVTLPVVSHDDCNTAYGGGITDIMFCAGYPEGGRDTCQGDSGGPAVNPEHVQVGIVSFGSGCARPGVPGVYSNVAALRDFIKDVAGA